MKQLLYLVGPPGVGKTTALAAALDRTAYEERAATLPHSYLGERGGWCGVRVGRLWAGGI